MTIIFVTYRTVSNSIIILWTFYVQWKSEFSRCTIYFDRPREYHLSKNDPTVHRPGDDRCQECDICARTIFRGEWRIATTHLERIRTAHSLTTRYWKCMVFSVCVYKQNSLSLLPLAVQQSCAQRQTRPPPRGSVCYLWTLHVMTMKNIIILGKEWGFSVLWKTIRVIAFHCQLWDKEACVDHVKDGHEAEAGWKA
jgi:hypothetical protein